MRRIWVALVSSFAGLALLALPGSAGAATTVGSNLVGTPDTGFGPPASSTAQRIPPTGATAPIAAPTAGVIVQILVKHGASGANPGTYGFRVLSGSPTTYTTPGVPGTLPDFTWPANDTPGTRLFTPSLAGVPKGIPIGAGDRLGVVHSSGTAGEGVAYASSGAAGATLDTVSAVHNSGSLNYGVPQANYEQLVQYQIEPDADSDGFGDETQDSCPTNAATQAACPATPAPAKQCKKKKGKKKGKSSADTAKKKKKGGCKRKRKKKK